jgi:hypothetical protein
LNIHYMRRFYTFLNLETTVSVQMQPMVAYFEEGCEEIYQTRNFTQDLHTHILPTSR